MTTDRSLNANVRVEREGDEWRVTVSESDGQPHVQTFRTMAWAMNYAEGQSMRLDLEQADIPIPSPPNQEPDQEELDNEQEPADKPKEVGLGRRRLGRSGMLPPTLPRSA